MQYGNGKFVENTWELQDCEIGKGVWRNFTDPDHRYGFTVFLPRAVFEEMEEEGWYVKHKEKYAGDNREYSLDVALGFEFQPPKITLIASDGASTIITEENVGLLQTADIERCDLIVRPRNWKKNGNSGVQAWVDTMTVWLKEPRGKKRVIRASFDDRDEEEEE